MNNKKVGSDGVCPRFDLHIHTTASDGTDSPEAVVALAAEKRFDVIAITDHDTIDGVNAAVQAGKQRGVRVIPGVEISAGGPTEVHVLGYGITHPDQLERVLAHMASVRRERMIMMVDKMRSLGVDVDLNRVIMLSGGTVGRSHLARVLVEMGVVRDVREAFTKYLSPGRPAYVEREKLSVQAAVELIASVGGLPVIAHPGQNHGEAYWGSERFRALKDYGLRGIEVYHMAHSAAQTLVFERIARREELLVTGGSDYHGCVKSVSIGEGMKNWKNRDTDFKRFMDALGEMQ